jgi:hypothetical protein
MNGHVILSLALPLLAGTLVLIAAVIVRTGIGGPNGRFGENVVARRVASSGTAGLAPSLPGPAAALTGGSRRLVPVVVVAGRPFLAGLRAESAGELRNACRGAARAGGPPRSQEPPG